MKIDTTLINNLVARTLKEDHASNDQTSRILFRRRDRAQGSVIFKGETGIFCGEKFARSAFENFSKDVRIEYLLRDGRQIKNQDCVLRVSGPAAGLLSAERTVLNFLGHLTGIATLTRRFVQARIKGSQVKISDTRKTHPLLRWPEKYAVLIGGGHPHRMDLKSMVMVKDNHLAVIKRLHGLNWPNVLRSSVLRWYQLGLEVEVEVDELKDLDSVLMARPHWVLLDNMDRDRLQNAIKRIHAKNRSIKIEVSGGIGLDQISRLSRLAIERISCGALTHSAKFADFSFELL